MAQTSYRFARSVVTFETITEAAPLMSKTMTLRGRCSQCDCAVELSFSPWTGTGPATAAEWSCPECMRLNVLPAIGAIRSVDRAVQAGRPVAPRPTD